MNIVVCLKQVPGTTDVKINPQTNTLVRQGIKNIINPFDSYALEEGVRLREKQGGRVTAISMGPPQAAEMLREAIALGADETVLLSDAAFAGADTWATAYTLAGTVRKLGACDLVICGRQSSDGDTAQVGPELAEMLGIPFIAYVSQVQQVGAADVRLKRMIDEGYEIVQAPLPCLITVNKEINQPRLPSLRGLARAKSAKILVWGLAELGLEQGRVGLAGSATQVVKIFSPERQKKARMLAGETAAQVEALLASLKEDGII
jgi:electron transfer flavoprotein beta subunit